MDHFRVSLCHLIRHHVPIDIHGCRDRSVTHELLLHRHRCAHSVQPRTVSAAGIPVAYLTAQVALTLAGFRPGKTVLAPAIGGSVGNAVTQLARALGAKHAISSTTNHAKAEQAKTLGFDEVIDTSLEKLGDGVRRISPTATAQIL